jgi:hypothetical protein
MSTNPLAQYAPLIKFWRAFNPKIDRWLNELQEAIRTAQTERGAGVLRQFKQEYPQATAFLSDLLSGTPEEVAGHLKAYLNIEVGPTGLQALAQIQKRVQEEFRKPRFARNEQPRLKG